MKKTFAFLFIILFFYLNLFVAKSVLLHFILALSILAYPLMCIGSFSKNQPKHIRKDGIITIVVWGIIIIPTGMFILMTLIFGLPPEGYTPLDMFG